MTNPTKTRSSRSPRRQQPVVRSIRNYDDLVHRWGPPPTDCMETLNWLRRGMLHEQSSKEQVFGRHEQGFGIAVNFLISARDAIEREQRSAEAGTQGTVQRPPRSQPRKKSQPQRRPQPEEVVSISSDEEIEPKHKERVQMVAEDQQDAPNFYQEHAMDDDDASFWKELGPPPQNSSPDLGLQVQLAGVEDADADMQAAADELTRGSYMEEEEMASDADMGSAAANVLAMKHEDDEQSFMDAEENNADQQVKGSDGHGYTTVMQEDHEDEHVYMDANERAPVEQMGEGQDDTIHVKTYSHDETTEVDATGSDAVAMSTSTTQQETRAFREPSPSQPAPDSALSAEETVGN